MTKTFKELLIEQYERLPELYEVEVEDEYKVYVWNKEDKTSITYKFGRDGNLKYTY